MHTRMSRRKLLQATVLGGAGLGTALAARSDPPSTRAPGPADVGARSDPYADRLLRWGGELGGSKERR